MSRNGSGNSKKAVLVFLFIVMGQAVFAAEGLESLNVALSTMLGFFSSGYMKAILTLSLAGLGVGLINNRGEPGVMKKFIPWIAACVILLSASGITGIIFTEDSGIEIEADYSNLQ